MKNVDFSKLLRVLGLSLIVFQFVSFMGCNGAERGPGPGNIQIKAAIIYDLGGAQAVAREDFHLINQDATLKWKESGLIKESEHVQLSFISDRLRVIGKKPSRFEETIKPHIVRTVTTDFEGNATFENVPVGEYFIYAITKTRGGWAVWNYRVSADSENKVVLLDNKNAWLSY